MDEPGPVSSASSAYPQRCVRISSGFDAGESRRLAREPVRPKKRGTHGERGLMQATERSRKRMGA